MQIKYTNGIGWGSNMLKSSQEKLQRQAERDSKVAFFEAQKENLKNRESLDLDDIAQKLELLHSYDDQIAAAKQEYNSSQMFHVMDEAIERGEQMAKEAKKNEPKTEEERREEAIKEANGTEDSEGMLSEILDEQLDTISDDNGTDTLVISGKGMEYCKQLYAAESENQTEEADAENLRLKSMQK